MTSLRVRLFQSASLHTARLSLGEIPRLTLDVTICVFRGHRDVSGTELGMGEKYNEDKRTFQAICALTSPNS
jgi:hypothetical protein